jgi:hypothetical protein
MDNHSTVAPGARFSATATLSCAYAMPGFTNYLCFTRPCGSPSTRVTHEAKDPTIPPCGSS